MRTGNKNNSEKKELKKIPLKGKTDGKSKRMSNKNLKVDTDFHHEHPFKEN